MVTPISCYFFVKTNCLMQLWNKSSLSENSQCLISPKRGLKLDQHVIMDYEEGLDFEQRISIIAHNSLE